MHASIDVRIYGGGACRVVGTFLDGRVVTAAPVLVKVPGTDYQCTNAGSTITAYRKSAEPPVFVVDTAQDASVE